MRTRIPHVLNITVWAGDFITGALKGAGLAMARMQEMEEAAAKKKAAGKKK